MKYFLKMMAALVAARLAPSGTGPKTADAYVVTMEKSLAELQKALHP